MHIISIPVAADIGQTCPRWCEAAHDTASEAVDDIREHQFTVWSAVVDGRTVAVEVTQTEALSTGNRAPVRVLPTVHDEIDASTALQLAAALLNATDYAREATQ